MGEKRSKKNKTLTTARPIQRAIDWFYIGNIHEELSGMGEAMKWSKNYSLHNNPVLFL